MCQNIQNTISVLRWCIERVRCSKCLEGALEGMLRGCVSGYVERVCCQLVSVWRVCN